MTKDVIARLTDSQRTYLRRVLSHRSSKEIAQEFDISAHTVDKRIKEAMRLLGVNSRIEAARLLSIAEASPGRQGLGAQSPDLAPVWESRFDGDLDAGRPRDGFTTHDERPLEGIRLREGDGVLLPLPLFARPRRTFTLWQRAGWIVGLTIALALAAGILLSGLVALSALVNSMKH